MTRKSWYWIGTIIWMSIATVEVVTGKAYSKLGVIATRHSDRGGFWSTVLINVVLASVCTYLAWSTREQKGGDGKTPGDKSN